MKSVLAGPKVHRSNRNIFADAPDVIERQTIDPICIAIAMSTGEIALVGEPKADRKTIAAGLLHHLAVNTYGRNNPSIARCRPCGTSKAARPENDSDLPSSRIWPATPLPTTRFSCRSALSI